METYDTWIWFVPIEWIVHLFPWRLLGLFVAFSALHITHLKFVKPTIQWQRDHGGVPDLLTMFFHTFWAIWATPALLYTIGSFFVTLYFVIFPR